MTPSAQPEPEVPAAPGPAERSPARADRVARACALLDAVNAADPHELVVGGVARPKELAHAELVTAWVRRLQPDASDELLVAARGHHARRWTIPRDSHPDGRAGYLRWRRDLKQVHVDAVAAAMREAGFPDAAIERAGAIVAKRDLAHDPDVQVLEDALCLTFLETQLEALADKLHDDDKLVDVLVKTLPKMSDAGRTAALGLDLPPRGRALLEQAVARASA
jgi:hypothetical protein